MAFGQDKQILLAQEATFWQRIGLSMTIYAHAVMNENQAAMTGADYNGGTEREARTSLAQRAIANAPRTAEPFAAFFAARAGASGLTWPDGQSAIDFVNSLTDAQFDSIVAADWNECAGWRQAD